MSEHMQEIEAPFDNARSVLVAPGSTVGFAESAQLQILGADRLARREKAPSTRELSSWVQWDRLMDFIGQPFDVTRIPLAKLHQMQRDSMIALGLAIRIMPMMRAKYHMRCSDPAMAAAADRAYRRIHGSWIMQFTSSFRYGYAGVCKRFEKIQPDWTYADKEAMAAGDADNVVKPVWSSSNVEMLAWKPFVNLPPWRISPAWNRRGEFNGINVSIGGTPNFPSFASSEGRQPDVPRPWALWVTHDKDSEFGSLWGYPLIGHAYRYWWSYWYQWAHVDRAFEKWADPPLKGWYPVSKTIDAATGKPVSYQDTMLDILEQARSGALVAMPNEVLSYGMGAEERLTNIRAWDIEQMKHNVEWGALKEWADYLDVMKLRSLIVPEQAAIEGKGGTSSRNVAATHGDLAIELSAAAMAEADEHVNRWILPQWARENYGPDAPSIEKVTTGFDPVDVDATRDLVRNLSQQDADKFFVDLPEVLEMFGIPSLDPEEIAATMRARAAEEERKQAQAMEAQANAVQDKAAAGVTELGQYYGPRERIELNEIRDVARAAVLEAMEMKEKRSVPEMIEEKIAEHADELADRVVSLVQERFELHETVIEGIAGNVREVQDRDPSPPVHLHMPDPPAPEPEAEPVVELEKRFERDDEGVLQAMVQVFSDGTTKRSVVETDDDGNLIGLRLDSITQPKNGGE